MKTALFALFVLTGAIAGADSEIPVTPDNYNYRPLGAGYDSRKSAFRGDCVEVTNTQTPDRHLTSGSMNLKLEASQSALAEKLGMAAGGRYRSGVTTTSASAEFLNESKSNAYSITYNYISEDSYQEYAENSAKAPILPRPGIETYLKDSRTFFTNCGNEYVYARQLSARLLVSMKISFVSKYERQRFAATFGIDSPAFSMNANLEKASQSFNSSNTISIRVEQQGGDPAKKGHVLCPKLEGGQPDPECARSARNVVNCSFGELGPCMQVIANVIAYANAQDGENFPKQIEGGKNYWVTKLITRPFVYIGAKYPAEPPKQKEDTFKAEVDTLSGIFEEEYEKWTYAHQLAFGKVPRLSERQREQMNTLEASFLKNMKRLSTGIENCYQHGYSKCSAEVQAIREEIGYTKPDRPGIAAIEKLTLPETFVQWCDLANNEHPSLLATIQSLKTHLVQTKVLDQAELTKGDLCVKLDDRLKSLIALDLSDQTLAIADLRPLGALTHLEVLKLPAKRIVSVADLKNLNKLRILDLTGNFVVDPTPLAALPSLESLNIANNKIGSLDAFTSSPSLRELDARGNNASLKCPLADPSGCKLLDFSKSTSVSLQNGVCAVRVGASAVDIGGGRILVSGGYSGDGNSLYRSTMEIQTRDKCTALPVRMTIGRAKHTSTLLPDGRVLIAGGYSDTLEIFDPQKNESVAVPSRLQARRAGHSATVIAGGKVVFVGGHSEVIELGLPPSSALANVEVFDSSTGGLVSWGNLYVPRLDHSVTTLADGRILILGGYQERAMVNVAEIINPQFGTIEMLDRALLTGRSGHSATLLNDGRVLIAGGYEWRNFESKDVIGGLASLEIFDPEKEEFLPVKDSLGTARGHMAAIPLPDGRVMFAGGDKINAPFDAYAVSGSAVADMEIFDPHSQGVYTAGRLSFARHLFSLAPVGKRSWLIIGGTGAPQSMQSSELIVYR